MEANIISIHSPPRRELLLITVQSPTAFFWRIFFGNEAKHTLSFCHSPIVHSVRIWCLGIAWTTILAQCASRAFMLATSYVKVPSEKCLSREIPCVQPTVKESLSIVLSRKVDCVIYDPVKTDQKPEEPRAHTSHHIPRAGQAPTLDTY